MAELLQVYAWATAAADHFDLSQRTRFVLQLCCEEAVSNVIRHGYKAPPEAGARIGLTLSCTDDAVLLTIEDHGIAFDPTGHATPAMPTSLDDAQIGGMGIHLMRQQVDAMTYERRGDLNRLTLRIARAAQRSTEPTSERSRTAM